MKLNEAAENAYKTAIKRERNGGAIKIKDILKHTAGEVIEAAQAREAWADNEFLIEAYKEHYAEELADVIICVLIAAYEDGVDIESAVNLKMQKNAQRAAMQGDKL